MQSRACSQSTCRLSLQGGQVDLEYLDMGQQKPDQTILGLGQIRMIVTWQPFVLGACQFLQQATDERHAMRQYLPGAEQQ